MNTCKEQQLWKPPRSSREHAHLQGHKELACWQTSKGSRAEVDNKGDHLQGVVLHAGG
jgi:hypothetical protein